MIGRKWSEPVVLMPPACAEDPTLHRDADGLWLYYSRGPSLQDQRVYRRRAETPTGPLGPEELVTDLGAHTRIERARVTDDTWLHTASWPGPPTGGIMAFQRHPWGVTRTLVLTIEPGTGWSYIAANPCCEVDPLTGEVAIIFEGCVDAGCEWKLYRASWIPGRRATVDPAPIMTGANPSTFVEGGVRHMTFSRLTDRGWSAGFETCVVSQPA